MEEIRDSFLLPPVSQEERNYAVIMSIGVLFFLFLSPLLGMLLAGDRPFLRAQSKKALNGTIAYALAMLAATLLNMTFVLAVLGLPILLLTVIVTLFAGIKGAMASSKGELYNYPFSPHLIK